MRSSFDVNSTLHPFSIIVGGPDPTAAVCGLAMEETLSPLGVEVHGDESCQSSYSPEPCDYLDAEDSKASLYSIREASEEDINIAKELLLHSHPFNQVKHTVSMNSRLKKKVVIDSNRLGIDVKAFLLQIQDLPSCLNKTMHKYVKCSCVKQL
jgi:hypothetical protein